MEKGWETGLRWGVGGKKLLHVVWMLMQWNLSKALAKSASLSLETKTEWLLQLHRNFEKEDKQKNSYCETEKASIRANKLDWRLAGEVACSTRSCDSFSRYVGQLVRQSHIFCCLLSWNNPVSCLHCCSFSNSPLYSLLLCIFLPLRRALDKITPGKKPLFCNIYMLMLFFKECFSQT